MVTKMIDRPFNPGDVIRIRITNCVDIMMWYVNKIGEEFDVLRFENNYYLLRDSYGFINIVYLEDCEPVKFKGPNETSKNS